MERAPNGRAAILILGMHRSGTAALAGVLNLLGAELPEGLLGPGYGDVLGHSEPERLVIMDDEILAAMGSARDDPRQIPSSWFRSRTAYTFHQRLREIILSEYAGLPSHCRQGSSDLPAGSPLPRRLDTLRIRPYVVLMVRHPVEVIYSLKERDDLVRRKLRLSATSKLNLTNLTIYLTPVQAILQSDFSLLHKCAHSFCPKIQTMNVDSENENQLPLTGERYVPQMTGQIQLEHVHRYLLAREYAKDKDVLDIACGEGFGSAILAKTARSVVVVDIATEAVEHAAAHYRADNVEFQQGSYTELPLELAALTLL